LFIKLLIQYKLTTKILISYKQHSILKNFKKTGIFQFIKTLKCIKHPINLLNLPNQILFPLNYINSMEDKNHRYNFNQTPLIPKVSYLSPITKRTFSSRSNERFNFNQAGFSSPRCVRASHEMKIPLNKTESHKQFHLDSSKSILLNNRRIGEKLLLDSFPK